MERPLIEEIQEPDRWGNSIPRDKVDELIAWIHRIETDKEKLESENAELRETIQEVQGRLSWRCGDKKTSINQKRGRESETKRKTCMVCL